MNLGFCGKIQPPHCTKKEKTRTCSWLFFVVSLVLFGQISCKFDSEVTKVVRVFAASSLKEILTESKRRFEREHPLIQIQLVFAGSQTLRFQIEQGASADLFLSAHPLHIQSLRKKGFIEQTKAWASNKLVVITPTNNRTITSFRELPRAKRFLRALPNVPIGIYTRQMLRKVEDEWGSAFSEKLRSRTVSIENNVRFMRAKIELKEADAAIVYETDALSSSYVRKVPIPNRFQVSVRYVAAQLKPKHPYAILWFQWLITTQRCKLLARYGFGCLASMTPEG